MSGDQRGGHPLFPNGDLSGIEAARALAFAGPPSGPGVSPRTRSGIDLARRVHFDSGLFRKQANWIPPQNELAGGIIRGRPNEHAPTRLKHEKSDDEDQREHQGHEALLDPSTRLMTLPNTERRFLGWTSPSLSQFSFMRLLPSTWLRRSHQWDLGSNLNGGLRAMVLTGHYDKVMPLNIMVDYLVRAVLAVDTDEAIALGILETDPEDFALCEFICPSKVNLQAIIRQGLDAIEEEGV